jgi:hypothetical protein
MKMFIYIYSYILIIIRSCIAKVVELFLFLRRSVTEKWTFWWDSHTKFSGRHLLSPTVSEANKEGRTDYNGANDESGAELKIRYDAGGRGPKVPNAAPTRILATRSATAWQLTIACAPLEICLESVFIGNVLRCATDLRLPLAKTMWWGINGEGFGKDWGPSREGAVDLEDKYG